MTVIERLKAAGYDPAKALWPNESREAGSMDCEHILIETKYCVPRDGVNALQVEATAMVRYYSDGYEHPYPAGWPNSFTASVTLFFPADMEFGSLTSDLSRRDSEFRYRLLDRCVQDCMYFLGAGRRHSKYLWGGNVHTHIKAMKVLWESFPDGEKPTWICLTQIERFEKQMMTEEIY